MCYVCNSLDTCTRIYRSEYLITVIMVFTIRPFFYSLMCLISCDFFRSLSLYFCGNFALLWILFHPNMLPSPNIRAKYMIIIIIIIVIHLYLLLSAHGKKRTQFLVIFLKLLLCEFSIVFEASFFPSIFFFSFTDVDSSNNNNFSAWFMCIGVFVCMRILLYVRNMKQ